LHPNVPPREQHVSFGAEQHTPAQHCQLFGQHTVVTVPSAFGLWQVKSPARQRMYCEGFGGFDGVATFTHRPLTQACVNVQN
jgi:hypothetical protein